MLSVVIPAHNEGKLITKTLTNLINFFKKERIKYEIIVVEDGSTDDTVMQVNNFSKQDKNIILFHNKKRLGKGKAVRIGFQKSKGDLILLYDADGSMPVNEIKKMMSAMDTEGIVIGSRYLTKSKLTEKKSRFIFSRMFNLLFRLLFFDVKDTQSGYKLINRSALNKILPKLSFNGFEWDIEFLKIAKDNNIIIKEIPIVWIHRNDSRVNPIKHGIKMFFAMLKLRFS